METACNQTLESVMKIPFGKPFPGIDPTSLRDGVAAGLVNGYINELDNYQIVPGLTEFGAFDGVTTFPPTVPGLSRFWDGTTANYLQTSLHGTFYGAQCIFAWIQVAALGSHMTIFGNCYDAGYGWRISNSSHLELFWSRGPFYDQYTLRVPVPGLTIGVPIFVAINIITTNPGPTTANFYAGLTPATIAFIGTETSAVGTASNGVQHIALGVNMYGLTPQVPFHGHMAKIGRYARNLTLDELKAIAVCGAVPPVLELSFYYEITGASPEADSGPFAYPATVIGSLPVGGGLC